jgi:hypothetical protein
VAAGWGQYRASEADAGYDRIGAGQVVEAGVMLISADLEAKLVAERIFFEYLIVQTANDGPIAENGSEGSLAPKAPDL